MYQEYKGKSGQTYLLLPPKVYEDLKQRADLRQTPEEGKVLSLKDQLVGVLKDPALSDQQKMDQYGDLTYVYRDWLKKLKTTTTTSGEKKAEPELESVEPMDEPEEGEVEEEDENGNEAEEEADIDLQSRPPYAFPKVVDQQPESKKEQISNFLDEIRDHEEGREALGWNRWSGEIYINSKKIPGSNLKKILAYLFATDWQGRKGPPPTGANLFLAKYKTMGLNPSYLPAIGKKGAGKSGGGGKAARDNEKWKTWRKMKI